MTDTHPAHRYRFAPSPTGALHIGGARTALYNWLARPPRARRPARSCGSRTPTASARPPRTSTRSSTRWSGSGSTYDEGPISQVGRADRHAEALEQLLASGARLPRRRHRQGRRGVEEGARRRPRLPRHADRGARRRDPPARPRRRRDDRRGRHPRRRRLPERQPTTTSSSPAPTARSLYNFAVAVDDARDGHHRGRPRRRPPLQHAEAAARPARRSAHQPPRYAHLPLLHGPDGKKLSKRHGAALGAGAARFGHLSAAVRTYSCLSAWATDDDTTLMSTDRKPTRCFEVADVGRSAAIFDEKKLRWLNGCFTRGMLLDEYTLAVALATSAASPRRAPARGLARSARRKRRRWRRSGRSILSSLSTSRRSTTRRPGAR